MFRYCAPLFCAFSFAVVSASAAWSMQPVGQSDNAQSPCRKALEYIIVGNNFNASRDLLEYVAFFGFHFYQDLLSLGPQDRWLDLGAGNTNALIDYYSASQSRLSQAHPGAFQELIQRPRDNLASGVAATYAWNPDYEKLPRIEGAPLKILHNQYFEEFSQEEIGTTSLVTDLYGVKLYTATPDFSLLSVLRSLRKGGVGYFHLGLHDELSQSTVHTVSGETISLVEWICRAPGIQCELSTSDARSLSPLLRPQERLESLRITKLVDGPVPVQELHLSRIQPMPRDISPVALRHFEETGKLAVAKKMIPMDPWTREKFVTDFTPRPIERLAVPLEWDIALVSILRGAKDGSRSCFLNGARFKVTDVYVNSNNLYSIVVDLVDQNDHVESQELLALQVRFVAGEFVCP